MDVNLGDSVLHEAAEKYGEIIDLHSVQIDSEVSHFVYHGRAWIVTKLEKGIEVTTALSVAGTEKHLINGGPDNVLVEWCISDENLRDENSIGVVYGPVNQSVAYMKAWIGRHTWLFGKAQAFAKGANAMPFGFIRNSESKIRRLPQPHGLKGLYLFTINFAWYRFHFIEDENQTFKVQNQITACPVDPDPMSIENFFSLSYTDFFRLGSDESNRISTKGFLQDINYYARDMIE